MDEEFVCDYADSLKSRVGKGHSEIERVLDPRTPDDIQQITISAAVVPLHIDELFFSS